MPTNSHTYTPQKREDYIAKCRYYKGEGVETANGQFASYERVWVDEHYSEAMLDALRFNLKAYKDHGLGHFSKDDGTPITLKALLFERYMHWCGSSDIQNDINGFKQWYKEEYLQIH